MSLLPGNWEELLLSATVAFCGLCAIQSIRLLGAPAGRKALLRSWAIGFPVVMLSLLLTRSPLLAAILCVVSEALTYSRRVSVAHRLDLFAMGMSVLPASFLTLRSVWLGLAMALVTIVFPFGYVFSARYRRFGTVFALSLILSALTAWLDCTLAWLCLSVAAAGAAMFAYECLRKPQKPLVLFDLDGTLIDSQNLVFETFRRVFAQKKPDYRLKDEELYSFFGPPLETTFARYFPPDQIDEIIDLYQKINLELHERLLRTMPHALETVRKLSEEGFCLGIVSNKRKKPVELGLDLSGLAPYFPLVLGKEDLPEVKPKPGGLFKAAEAAGFPMDRVVYVGDNASDIQAATNAGMYSVGYTLDEVQKKALSQEDPCKLIDDLSQLSSILMEDRLWIDKSTW